MLADADLAAVAELMSAHRATLLLALIGGRALSASELAARADISRSLASAHLSRLLEGSLICVEQHGRQRHYRLASPQVAEVIEAMLTIAPDRHARGLRESSRGAKLRHARTCYDHLAGTLGVAVTDSLQRQRLLQPAEGSYRLTPQGQRRFEDLGLDIAALRQRRRTFARPVWTGPSAAPTSPARSAPASPNACSNYSGFTASRAAAPSRSPTPVTTVYETSSGSTSPRPADRAAALALAQ